MKFAHIVVGPAGSGKSTYCKTVQEHCDIIGRVCKVINLDPAAEELIFNYDIDVRELIKSEEVMQHFGLGPNGSLMFCMEYLLQKIDWLEEMFNSYNDDDFIIIDCPGQLELYTNSTVIKAFLNRLIRWDYHLISIYCMDVSFISDPMKYVAGTMAALSVMVTLELPCINLLTKCDLLSTNERENIEEILDRSSDLLNSSIPKHIPDKYKQLISSISNLLEDWSMVKFIPFNIEDEETIFNHIVQTDMVIGYSDNVETKDVMKNSENDNTK